MGVARFVAVAKRRTKATNVNVVILVGVARRGCMHDYVIAFTLFLDR